MARALAHWAFVADRKLTRYGVLAWPARLALGILWTIGNLLDG